MVANVTIGRAQLCMVVLKRAWPEWNVAAQRAVYSTGILVTSNPAEHGHKAIQGTVVA